MILAPSHNFPPYISKISNVQKCEKKYEIMKLISQDWWIFFIKFGDDNIVDQYNYLWLYQICLSEKFGMVSALYEVGIKTDV